jgi:ArsR family transcriptional regulator
MFVNTLDRMKRTTDPDIRLLQAAADPTRLAILRELSDLDAVCACDFTACCDVAQPTVSHHLKVLREAGWVSTERRGSYVYYTLAPAAAERFRTLASMLTPARSLGAGAVSGRRSAPAGTGTRRLPVVQPST